MEEPTWKKTTLSLERPYQDDNGEPIPVLLDITSEGHQVFEPPRNTSEALEDNLRRIFIERGVDFFERQCELPAVGNALVPQRQEASRSLDEESGNSLELAKLTMSPEELFKMRMEFIPQLYIALGEMTQARDLLSFLLSSTSSSQVSPVCSLPPSSLTATGVTKPQAVPSLAAFNAQLTIGGKDEALRKAANVFKQAVSKLERGRLNGERYWADALKIRRGNWGLTPAPLPFGALMGKGADKTSKDFLISFGLEEGPIQFRRRAVAHLATYESEPDVLVLPHCSRTRLCVSLIMTDQSGGIHKGNNTRMPPERSSLESSLKTAQREIVDEEVFSVLIREANNLPTVSARVAERLIVIDAAPGIELQFEMVDIDASVSFGPDKSDVLSATCDLIYHILQALLLSLHDIRKSQRIATAFVRPQPSAASPPRSDLLQPIIDLLQYQRFCDRIKAELDRMISSLQRAGVPCTLRFDPVGEAGENLQHRLTADDALKTIGGEALLRIYDRQTLRLTFSSPSSLVAHVSQATLPIASVPQLSQLLFDEVEKCLLGKLCEAGDHHCERVDGTWFVDTISGETVGRWEGCVLKFCIAFGQNSEIYSSAFRLERGGDHHSLVDSYSPKNNSSLMAWQHEILQRTLTEC
ncbi:subunit 17 of mediator complex-domain-containing protein [Phlebopus sp. FC_14]|nr:subunit 17 of mediator complex-domain-containing protein [Phlebopus sp. FC_14]